MLLDLSLISLTACAEILAHTQRVSRYRKPTFNFWWVFDRINLMFTAKEYIEKRLTGIKEEKITQEKELAVFIYDRILSKKFKKYSVTPAGSDKIHRAIELNIKNNEPIKFVISAGSYKLWKFEECPEPDWAELFAMIYYAYWLKPITDVYKPGVWFDFFGDDAILELMNNIPEKDTEKYKAVFKNLIKFIQPYLPNNLKFTFTPIGERYSSKEKFLDDLNEKIKELKKIEESTLPEQEIERMKRNVRPCDGKEINALENHILHDAYMNASEKRPYYKTPDKIMVSARPYGDRTSVPVGTTKTSVVQYQTGVGVLKREEDSFIEYVYSTTQLEGAKFVWEEVCIDGLVGKNFSKIRII